MFYLNFFFNIIRTYPVRSLVFIFFYFAVVLTILQSEEITFSYKNKLSVKNKNPYFYVLTDKTENYMRVIRKLIKFPGIYKVNKINQKKINENTKKFLTSMNFNNSSDLIKNLNYSGFKVSFNQDLKLKSIDLIKDYLTRFIGEEKVTIGSLRNYGNKLERRTLLEEISNYISWIVLSVLTVFLLLSFFSFNRAYQKRCYLIEKFQRRKSILLKGYLSFFILLGLISLILSFIIGKFNFYLVLFIIVPVFFLLLFKTQPKWTES